MTRPGAVPAPELVEELASLVLPAALEALAAQSAVYRAALAAIEAERDDAWEALERVDCGELEAGGVGWTLAFLARARGSDVLLERRNPLGWRHLVGLLERALLERGVQLSPPAERLPALDEDAGGGVALLALSVVFARVGARVQAPGSVRWSLRPQGPGRLELALQGTPATGAAQAATEVATCPRLELLEVPGGMIARFPAEWMQWARPAPQTAAPPGG